MKRTLEIIVWSKLRKGFEFKQTLDCLSGILEDFCTSMEVVQSENGKKFALSAAWENSGQMHDMLQSKEFLILAGAIDALCEKSEIRLDDKPLSTDISKLTTIN